LVTRGARWASAAGSSGADTFFREKPSSLIALQTVEMCGRRPVRLANFWRISDSISPGESSSTCSSSKSSENLKIWQITWN